MTDLPGQYAAIVESAAQAQQGEDAGGYARLAALMTDCQRQLTAHMRQLTRSRVEALIRKLGGSQPIAPEEVALMRAWLVGDADSYVKVENSVPDWQGELRRLVEEIGRRGSGSPDLAASLELGALLQDGIRVAWDLYNYLEQKERVHKFEEATAVLDGEERRILARLLKDRLAEGAT
jgi:hypothetical protein